VPVNERMILVAVGANLAADGFASPLATCEAAVGRLSDDPDLAVMAVSRWYESEPVPRSEQPWYVNGVVRLDTPLDPAALLARLHAIEASFGRVRRVRNEARPLDLDIIDYRGLLAEGGEGEPILPHPRARERLFVLLPLRDVAPAWRHPTTDENLETMIAALPADETVINPLEMR